MSKYRLISLLFLLSPLSLLAQTPTWVNGQAARVLIGQATWAFGSLAMPNQSTLGAAGGVAYANGTLWVADATTMTGLNPNNGLPIPSGVTSGTYTQDARVLGFPTSSIPLPDTDLTPFAAETCSVCGFSANIVLGQTNFTTFAPGTSQSATSGTGSMNDPTGVASDGNRLAVADYGNNRVLLWNATPNSINAPPDIVLGQASFTTNSSSVTSATFRGPQGVWINPDGHVFVADAINNRVLIWNHFPTSNGQPADVVLGQTNFNTGTQPACNISVVGETVTTAANQLCNPTSVTSDGTRVYVADFGF
ncbi:MAG: hypothetical protein JO319_15600, partial [Acidobacteriaceae bacterium]|nr:hypothetical protein [Acidobacteriaceae bacterium]